MGEDGTDTGHFLVSDGHAAAEAAADAGATDVQVRRVVVIELAQLGMGATEALDLVASRGGRIDLAYLAANGALVVGLTDASRLEAVAAALRAEGR